MIKTAFRILLLAVVCEGFYTRLSEGEEKCFVEEVGPVIDAVTVRYNSTSANLRWEVRHFKTVILDILRKDKYGAFEFLTLQDRDGPYEVCATTFKDDGAPLMGQNPTLQVKIDKSEKHRLVDQQKGTKPLIAATLNVEKEEEQLVAEDLERSAAYLSEVLIEIHDLKTEAQAMVIRQNRFKVQSENTFSRVVSLSVLTCAVVSVVFYLEYNHLKNFLREKKVV
eukprot:TRINITY_DN3052_c5_g1_i1.p1 TRINITY_DN3052_c5_g1~~TRINITY_DN3052_c5_g1_i1.p1  ORF type:complete len:246 (+),score=62.11 TRINITY_DN3052_c5_g1_i1:69-740(+)